MRRSYFRLLEGVLLSLPLLFASCGNGDNALEEIINGGGSGSGGGGSESSGTYLVYSYAIGTGISSEETQIPSDAKTDADMTNSWAGTYYIKSNKTITGDVTFTDNVKLILKDGVELTVNGCIYGGADYGTAGTYSLYVYAQSGNTGALTINSNDGFDVVVDKLEIHGGVIHASNSEQAFEPNGEFKIYNGNVTAEGTMNGIMIMDKMYVYGGTLTATSTTDPTVGGSYGISGNFTMYDGNVTTTGGDAATGSGYDGYAGFSGKLTIEGGTFNSEGGNGDGGAIGGAGISGIATFNGGTITAKGIKNRAIEAGGDININDGITSVTLINTAVTGVTYLTDWIVLGSGSIRFGGTDITADWVSTSFADPLASHQHGTTTIAIERDGTSLILTKYVP